MTLAASVERASPHLSVVLPALLEVQVNLGGDPESKRWPKLRSCLGLDFTLFSPKRLVGQSSSTRCASDLKERPFACCPNHGRRYYRGSGAQQLPHPGCVAGEVVALMHIGG
jgi:hypothetical protein